MKIKFWGARGSIPVSGEKYLKYGGDTTCVEIRAASGELVIVDAGSGIRLLGKELVKEGLSRFAMLFTHSHWDHVLGFPFFAPIYRKKVAITMMGCSFSEEEPLREIISKTMRPPGFPVKFEEISASFSFAPICRKGFEVGSMKIDPIEISHPNQGLGYKFTEDGKTFVFLTDNELGYRHEGGRNFEEYAAFAKGADVLVHDADYTDEEYPLHRTWGHSTSGQALELAVAAGVSSLGLFHHNQERGDAELDSIVAACARQLEGRDGAPSSVFAVRPEQEIIL